MLEYHRSHTWLLIAVALLLFAVGTNAPAAAQEGAEGDILLMEDGQMPLGTVQDAVPGGPGYIMISPTQFRAKDDAKPAAFNASFNLYNPNATEATFIAPLILPHQATFTKMVVYFYDVSDVDLDVNLWLCATEYGYCSSMAGVVSTGSSASFRDDMDLTFNYPDINNQIYTYLLAATIDGGAGSNLRIAGVRLDYEIPSTTYLPIFMD